MEPYRPPRGATSTRHPKRNTLALEFASLLIAAALLGAFHHRLPMVGEPTFFSRILFAFVYLVQPTHTLGMYIAGFLSTLGWSLSLVFAIRLGCRGKKMGRG